MWKHPLLYVAILLLSMFAVSIVLPTRVTLPVDRVVRLSELPDRPLDEGQSHRAQDQQTSGQPAQSAQQAQNAKAYDPGCPYPKGHDDADLCEQRRMAKAAEESVAIANSQLWLTVLNLLLLLAATSAAVAAAKYAKQAADAGRRGVAEAAQTNMLVARTAALEVRAYLSVLPGGINELIGSRQAMGHVEVKNVGRLPAREVWIHVRMRIGGRDDQKPTLRGGRDHFEVPDDPYSSDPLEFSVDRAILPGTMIRQGAAERDAVSVRELLAHKNMYVYVWGVVHYSDGTQRRFTKFRHRYAIASHSPNDWQSPAHETRKIIGADKARYHPFGNSAN